MRQFFDNKTYILAVLIAFATILVYLPSIYNGFVTWDDDLYVYDNPYIRSLNLKFFKWAFFSFHAAFWIPLTWISYAIDYAFWGLNPMGYHLTNVILHGLNTFLVVVLIARLTSIAECGMGIAELNPKSEIWRRFTIHGSRFRFTIIAAGTTGLLFGLHPIHVESVAWATERKDVLYAFFFLLSILSYMSYAKYISQSAEGIEHGAKIYFAFTQRSMLFALCFFILALLSKPMAVSLPFVLLILDWYPFRRFEIAGKQKLIFIEKIPFFILSLVSAGIIITGHYLAGGLESLTIAPVSTRILVAFKSLVSYLGKMLLPINLIPFYPYPKEVSLLSLKYLLSVLLVVGITVACISVSKKQRVWLAVWAYYIVALFPVLGLFQAGRQEMADRFTYLPSVSIFLMVGLGAAWFYRRLESLKRWNLILKTVALTVFAVFVISMSYATIRQIGIWKDSIILWSRVIEKEPEGVPIAYRNRGTAYYMRGEYEKAIEDYNSAIILNMNDEKVYHDRGVAYEKIGRYDKAIEDFNSAIILKPDYVEAYHDRGIAYGRIGQYERAIEDFNSAIALNPNYAKVYNDRGVAYDRMGQYERAIEDFSKAITLNPDNALSYSNRGLVYFRLAIYEEALKDLTTAIRLNPNSPELYLNRGNIYRILGRSEEAERDFMEAERIKP